jgi:hypothetical protein
MPRSSTSVDELNDRLYKIELYLWGPRIDDDDFIEPGPPHPGGLHGLIEDLQTAADKVEPSLTWITDVLKRLGKRAEVGAEAPA